jgi:hypothetical protein
MMTTRETFIENAGIVLLHNYLPALFTRLRLTMGKGFTDLPSCHKALLALHFISTASDGHHNLNLPLNNILCGLPTAVTPQTDTGLRIEDELIIEGMLSTAIGSWPQVSSSSIGSFRRNWLWRGGILKRSGKHWELKVETLGQDTLLRHFPFPVSLINYPWMYAPLRIVWDY